MNQWKTLLQEHVNRCPTLEPQDVVKFLYQSFMGPGHLVIDRQTAHARLKTEWDRLPADATSPLCEPLGNGLCRLDLRACKAMGLSPGTATDLFIETANRLSPDRSGLEQALTDLSTLPGLPDGLSGYLEAYRAEGCRAVSHSPAYRAAYSPSYRVVFQRYIPLLPLLAAIDHSMASGEPALVALDGPCASGKTTLGQWLAKLYQCPLVHMDDFFLLPAMRTPERLAQPGGNVDCERFDRQVLTPLSGGQEARYQPWRCSSGDFGPERIIPPGPVTVVEGSYSLRPDLRGRYTHRVWVEAPWDARRERLLKRGGPDVLARYEEIWIPLEDRYFAAFQVKDCCDFVLSGMG